MRLIVALVVSVLPSVASAQNPRPKPADVGAAIERGLGFLVTDARAWKNKHHCVSCHHAALVVWSMREARRRGHAVDEPFLAELTKWVAESGDGKTGVPRPAGAPKALNAKAVWFALALAAGPKPDAVARKGLTRLWGTVKSDQTEKGSWSAWPETRPPIFGGSDDSMTALATLAMTAAAAAGDAEAKGVRDKGVRWLAETKSDDDPQSVAVRLVLWNTLGRPDKEWQPLVRRIEGRQNADGGWSQAKGMASDAWATGQALYALAHAGIKPDDLAVRRGQAFLARTQRADGAWPMTSRPVKRGGEGSKSLIPITGAGSAWAVLGLVRSQGPPAAGGKGRDKPAGAAEQYKELLEKYQRASGGAALTDEERMKLIGRVYALRNHLAQKFVELAEKHPRDPIAVDALMQAVWQVNSNPWPIEIAGKDRARGRALALLERDHIRSDKLGSVCQRISYGFCKEYETFLRAVLERNPHRQVQALACLGLAHFLINRLQRLDLVKEQPRVAREFAALFGKEYLRGLLRQDRARVVREAEALFERAAKQYGDVKIPDGPTVKEKARAELFEIRRLVVGKEAPDIKGEDQDGKRFRLRDYRGKVVLLDFWSPV
jgi:hypothetical protein